MAQFSHWLADCTVCDDSARWAGDGSKCLDVQGLMPTALQQFDIFPCSHNTMIEGRHVRLSKDDAIRVDLCPQEASQWWARKLAFGHVEQSIRISREHRFS